MPKNIDINEFKKSFSTDKTTVIFDKNKIEIRSYEKCKVAANYRNADVHELFIQY